MTKPNTEGDFWIMGWTIPSMQASKEAKEIISVNYTNRNYHLQLLESTLNLYQNKNERGKKL